MTPKRGGRWRDHRPVLNGIVFRTRAGIPWRDLPERSGPWETVYKRFARWQTDGTWARIEATLGTQADGLGSWTGTPRLTPASSAPTRDRPSACWWLAWIGGSPRYGRRDGHGWADTKLHTI